jgi:hypothetical protein
MNKSIIILFLFISGLSFSQKEGQNFCKGIENGSYFPLDIKKKKSFGTILIILKNNWVQKSATEKPI